ncbi:MAG TPA: TonB-dependent receptor [Polyangiales bacterium]|nr:TonB-dependent receptor [Polyangiales bacterium]
MRSPRLLLARRYLVAIFGLGLQDIGVVFEVKAQSDYRAAASASRQAFDSTRSELVVDRADAERTLAENVGDMLSHAEGTVVSRTASASAAPILRGQTGSAVLLMVDELRLNDSLTRPGGNALLNLLDPESVLRIEVVRGPASVLYGSDALGGVVRVVTRALNVEAAREPSARASVAVRGALAERAARIGGYAAGVESRFGAWLSAGRGHTGLVQRGGDLGEQPYTGHEDATFAGRLELVPARKHRIAIALQSGHSWDMPRSDVSTPEDVQTTLSLDRDAMLVKYSGDFAGDVSVRAYAATALRREHRQRVRDSVEDERESVLSYHFGAGVSLLPLDSASLELGVQAVRESVHSSGAETDGADIRYGRGRYVDDSRYDTSAAYGLWSQQLAERWTWLAGVRATFVSALAPPDPLFEDDLQQALDRQLFGVVGSLGTRFDLREDLSWSLSLLSGFRAPNLEDFQAFGGGARGFSIPNADLHEERSWTLETGLKAASQNLQASVFVFGTLLDGLIVRVPTEWDGMSEIEGEPIVRRENASHSTLFGAEAELRAQLDAGPYVAAGASAVWGETTRPDERGRDVDEPASKIPGPQLGVRAGYERASVPLWGELSATFQLPQSRLSESDRMDVRLCADPQACERVAGYVDLTLRGGVRVARYVSLNVALENLLDSGYKTYASGAYAPGRNLVAMLRGSL